MQVQELPLYPTQKHISSTSVNSEKVILFQQSVHPLTPKVTLDNVLHNIFPQNSDVNNISRTRKLLGKTAENLSDEQIQCIFVEFQFLINSWLDEFERDVFGGKTLKEVLNEK